MVDPAASLDLVYGKGIGWRVEVGPHGWDGSGSSHDLIRKQAPQDGPKWSHRLKVLSLLRALGMEVGREGPTQ